MKQQIVFIITLSIVILVMVGLIIWDIFLWKDGKPGNTISEAVLEFSRRNPLIPFAAGLIIGTLAGHFWWTQ